MMGELLPESSLSYSSSSISSSSSRSANASAEASLLCFSTGLPLGGSPEMLGPRFLLRVVGIGETDGTLLAVCSESMILVFG